MSNRIEHNLETSIVLAFEVIQPEAKFGVGREDFAESDKRSHYLDVHRYRTLTP